MVVPISKENFARMVWELNPGDNGIDFYQVYDAGVDLAEELYCVKCIEFAEATMVIANYYGGSTSYFCMETQLLLCDTVFKDNFVSYLNYCGFGDQVYVIIGR